MTSVRPLAELRQSIDALDQQLLVLMNQRAELAIEVAKSKIANGDHSNFYRPEREAEVLRQIQASNPGPLKNKSTVRLFRELMSACLALEEPLKIAFLGPEGTYSQQAAYQHFGHAVATHPVASIHEVFRAVENNTCPYGIVPVENSAEGVVAQTLDCFLSTPLPIIGETELRVRHQLMSRQPDLDRIQTVYAHSQSLGQCREWLLRHLPKAGIISTSSNAEAARLATEQTDSAAIASETAADLYQLPILASHIEDQPNNTTRFLVIGKQQLKQSGQDKTSLLLSMGNQPGALVQALRPFSDHKIGMTRIESRPSRRGMWDYVFFIDIEGHQDDLAVTRALATLESQTQMLKILGSYPRVLSPE